MSRRVRPLLLLALAAGSLAAQVSPTSGVTHGQRVRRLAIRNALVIDGNGTPARGPMDIIVEGNVITEMVSLDPVALRAGRSKRPAADAEIDATGKYVLPGLINAHAHMQSQRSGQSMGGFEYNHKIWLANGITTVREVGAESESLSVVLRGRSQRGEIVAPRMFIYPFFDVGKPIATPAEARTRVQFMKRLGVDGIKIGGIQRDIMAAMEDEAHKLGLRIAHHVGVEETNAWDDVKFGTTSIEHWYGIPDAAIPDLRQHFPSQPPKRLITIGAVFLFSSPRKLAPGILFSSTLMPIWPRLSCTSTAIGSAMVAEPASKIRLVETPLPPVAAPTRAFAFSIFVE